MTTPKIQPLVVQVAINVLDLDDARRDPASRSSCARRGGPVPTVRLGGEV